MPKRKLVIQATEDMSLPEYWTEYDSDIDSLASANDRMAFLVQSQPDRSFQLVEVLSWTEDGEVRS